MPASAVVAFAVFGGHLADHLPGGRDAIVILDVFQKKTTKTPPQVLETCRQRLRVYDAD